MRYIYIILLYIALPFIFLRLWWRSRRQPALRTRWGERLGFYPRALQGCVWVHTVSVGETIAAIPLIKALQALYPQKPFLVTTMTATGAARVQAQLGESVVHAYIPYDFPGAVKRFLRNFKPEVGVIMETELWPNLLAACAAEKVPVCVLNARLSEKSAKGYARIGGLMREMLGRVQWIATAGEADAKRFIALGADSARVSVAGNIKFDLTPPEGLEALAAAWRAEVGVERFVWVAASTHEGEEVKILKAHAQLCEKIPNALLILVPRHPERFDEVARLCEAQFSTARRSVVKQCGKETTVYLADTMGELLFFFAACDVAFVGGSLIERGGHNILEPAVFAKPIICGPHVFNFQEICDLFQHENALTIVTDENALATALEQFAKNPTLAHRAGERAKAVMLARRGALQRQLAVVSALIKQK